MHRHLRSSLAAAAALVLLAAGCGDDDDEAGFQPADDHAPADGGDDTADYCEAALAIATVPPPDIDFESATPDEIAAALKSFAADTMQPLAQDVISAAPEELADEFEILQDALDEMKATGDGAVFETPEATAADATVHDFDLENCGWESVAMRTVDYAFEGIPSNLPAGVTSFDFTNEGSDAHEIALMRKNSGVDDSAEDLLQLGDAEAASKVTFVGVGGPIPAGGSEYLVADLVPGHYIAVCFLPVGMTGMDGPPPDGPPHFSEGMVTEFTVD